MANLLKYEDASVIGVATIEQIIESQEQARRDGGAGVIAVNGLSCYADGTATHRVRMWDDGASDEWWVVDGKACDAEGKPIKGQAIKAATTDLVVADEDDDLERVVIDSWSDGYDGDAHNIRAEVEVLSEG